MNETGRILTVNGNRAEVEVAARAECAHCSSHSLCNWTGTTTRRVLVVNKAGAAPGDLVIIETVEGSGVRSNLLVFGLPAVLLVAGVLVGGLVLRKDLWSGILSGAGLLIGLVVLKVIDTAVGRSGAGLPVAVRRLDRSVTKGVECEQVPGSGDADVRDGNGRG